MGKHQNWSETDGGAVSVARGFRYDLRGKEETRPGKQAWDWLVERFQQVLGPEGCSWLCTWPRVIRAGGECPSV